jgi:ADP-heptose:LPS heptosyltransferase
MDFGELFRTAEEVRRQAPGATVRAWLRSELEDRSPFALLPVDAIEEMPEAGMPEGVCLLVGSGRSRRWAFPALESPEARAAGQAFFRALVRESPRWVTAPGTLRPVLPEAPRFLVHQARFHVGDTLWLTPLLRAIRRFFPGARITVVGPPVARQLLEAEEIIPYAPGLPRPLGALAGQRFDAALFAFARRPESRWLAKALARAGVPYRINLEYFDLESLDPALDSRQIPPWLTHEGWFFWGALPSPRMLLHALDPLLEPGTAAWTEEDRRVEIHVTSEARQQAAELLAERGIGNEPFAILAPGGHSSRLWPAGRFAGLARRLAVDLGLHVLIEGSPAERALLEQIAMRGEETTRHILAAPDPLPVFAALLERARLLVANDSAPIHLAEATGTPTLYFAQREKLVHSHPAGEASVALYDEIGNDPARITVDQALSAARCAHRALP